MDEREIAERVLQPRDSDSLEILRSKSPETLQHYRDIVGEEWYNRHVISLPFRSKSLTVKNPIKNDVVYTALNNDQRSVFKDLHIAISESYDSEKNECHVTSPKILLLDSPSGTGKSFLLKLLSLTLNGQMISIEYSRELTHKMECCSNTKSYTYHRFLMDVTEKSLNGAKSMFPDEDNDNVPVEEMALGYWNDAIEAREENGIEIEKPQVLILNEYTRFSPWFLYFLMVYAYAKRVNLLFVGDRDELNAIKKTGFHNANNHTIVSYVADQVFNLPGQVRNKDKLLHSLISTFQKELNFTNVVPMSFKYAYLVYHTFPEKFFLPEDFENNLFLAHYHEQLAKRTLRFLDHLRRTRMEGQDWHKLPYYVGTRSGPNEPISMDKVSYKFLPFLLLVKGCRYFYKDRSRRFTKIAVRFLDCDKNSVLTMMDEENRKEFLLGRVNLTSGKYLLDEFVEFLQCIAGKEDSNIWHYPLTAYSSTYHAAQSLEISSDKTVELDLDARNANSIYVGLTRLNNSSQLGKIHSELLPSLIITHYFNDKYYYKVNRSKKDFCDRLVQGTRTYYENNVTTDLGIDKLQFETINDVHSFEKYNGMYKIERCLFDRDVPAATESQLAYETRLISFCKFVKHVFATEGAAAATTYENEPFREKYQLWST